MPRAIVFDVNETLLDLASLDPLFERVYGDAGARREWFGMLLRSAFTATLTDRYRPFGALAREALDGLADARSVTPSDGDLTEILTAMSGLPAHPDADPGLEKLAAAGYRLAALTNSAPDVAERQLESAGIRHWFDEVVTVDVVKLFKPAREVYAYAVERLGAAPADLVMVAAHDWDLHGARAAGLGVAYVERPGMSFTPRDERPALSAPNLRELADLIIAERE